MQAVERTAAGEALAPPRPYAAWEDFPNSCLLHHGSACCDVARAWFLSMDHALLAGESRLTGPRWVRARYDWGPSAHPISWCEAVKRKTLDCGALAALSLACFRERGVTAFPAQFVQRYSGDAAAHWGDRWAGDSVSTHWITGELIYHEGCAVLQPSGDIRLWDASAAWWLNPAQTAGYGSLAALKVRTEGDTPRQMGWGGRNIPADEWTAC